MPHMVMAKFIDDKKYRPLDWRGNFTIRRNAAVYETKSHAEIVAENMMKRVSGLMAHARAV